MLEHIKQAASFLTSKTNLSPKLGIILGTGLGSIATFIDKECEFDYSEIPNFPISTVHGHKGKLIIGKLNGVEVVAMQGRFHFYEGYDMHRIAFPIRVMKYMGIESLIVSNASGGLNPEFEIGDLMVINDHINLFPTNPLIGPNMEELGPRFPDMSEAYKKEYIKNAFAISKKHNIKLHQGVYAGLTGPTFETPAEYKYIRIIGADAVGMSTVPEVIAARHMNMKVFGISVITDLGVEGSIEEISHEDVIENAKKNEKNLVLLVKELVKTMH
ncbi:MAG: purine-nucleoside phosphorylase [Salibacteraceae bacterium]|jgi:purine-nucleoside phosphorylase